MRAAIAKLRLRRAAVRLAEQGWDVIRGACWVADRYHSGPGCGTVSCHPAFAHGEALLHPFESSWTGGRVAGWWREREHRRAALHASNVDVLEVPAYLGLTRAGSPARGPVAATGTGRYLLIVRSGGAQRAELAALPDVVLHGAGSWVQLPPACSPRHGVRWIVSPEEVGWQVPAPGVVQEHLARALPRLRAVTGPGRRGPLTRAA